MKKTIFILLLSTSFALSQEHSIGVHSGVIDGGYTGSVYMNFYNKKNNSGHFLQSGVILGMGRIRNNKGYFLDYKTANINTSYNFRLGLTKNQRQKQAFNFGFGGFVGVDQYNEDEESFSNGAILNIENEKIYYGPLISVELEFYVSYKLSVILKAQERYKANYNVNQFANYFSVGLQYFL